MKALNLKNLVCFLFVVFVSSCSTQQPLTPLSAVHSDVILKNGNVEKGKVSILKPKEVSVNDKIIMASDVKEIQFYNKNVPERKHILKYMPIDKRGSKIWVVKMSQGEYLDSYIGALKYQVNDDGTLKIIDYAVESIGSGFERPSFPVFMKKKGATEMKRIGSAKQPTVFRSGISRYLKDDPKFCEYVRYRRMGINELDLITANYVPNRQGQLTINGKKIGEIKHPFLTYDFDKEVLYNLEMAYSPSERYGYQYSFGGRVFFERFVSIGTSLGVLRQYDNFSVYKDKKKYLQNFNIYLGGALPMCFHGKYYLVPALHGFAGFRSDIAFLYGPMANLDFGIKLPHGNILFIGAGYRYNVLKPLFDEEDPGNPFNNIFIRISYKR